LPSSCCTSPLADALVSAEDRLARLPRGAVLRALAAPLVAALMVVGSWPVVRSVVAEARARGDRRWLAFLEGRVGRGDVVLDRPRQLLVRAELQREDRRVPDEDPVRPRPRRASRRR
jgi:hypothetical protein